MEFQQPGTPLLQCPDVEDEDEDENGDERLRGSQRMIFTEQPSVCGIAEV